MQSIIKLISLLTKKEKSRLIPLASGVLMMSFFEVAAIGSLGPFMSVVSNASIIHSQPILSYFYTLGNFKSDLMFIIALGIAVSAIILISTAFKIIVRYAIFRYAGNRRYTLSHRLFRQYLYQPYSYFIDHNTSELSKNLLSEVDMVIEGVFSPSLDSFSRGILSISILTFLFLESPVIASVAALVFGVLFTILYGFVRPRIMRHGKAVREANRLRFKATSEAFASIKEIKILGKEHAFSQFYAKGAQRFASTQASKQILVMIPGDTMQSMSIAFSVALLIAMLAIYGSIARIIPVLTVFLFGIVRMMPNLQRVFQNITLIRYHRQNVDALYNDFKNIPSPPEDDREAENTSFAPYPFSKEITLKNICFSYSASRSPVLKNIDLSIKKNTTIGLAGTTGSGKTTLVDVIMYLLEPSHGEILVDNQPVSDKKRWQHNFGYVPQQISLIDDTITANIAFGVPEHLRHDKEIERAAWVANIHEFVTTELPDGYETIVGERGIRLSGGQRQRVGIARALYHDPDILVLDEATSALDSVTENTIMDAIQRLKHTITIIIIAHRITTIQDCDEIFLIEEGRIADQGTYKYLLNNNSHFRDMTKANEKKPIKTYK
jgi:ABC-type multidrug transport system fused ATPase/permease subunit